MLLNLPSDLEKRAERVAKSQNKSLPEMIGYVLREYLNLSDLGQEDNFSTPSPELDASGNPIEVTSPVPEAVSQDALAASNLTNEGAPTVGDDEPKTQAKSKANR